MSKLKVLIVEDKLEESQHLETKLIEFGYNVVGIANNINTAHELFLSQLPHICLLDIYLNGDKPDGIVFAQQISSYNKTTAIIFLTASYDNATFYLAKTVNPHSYLLKPYNPLELQYAIELAMEKKQSIPIQEKDMLFVKRGDSIVRIELNNIKYIEVDGKYCKIICSIEKFIVQQALKDLLAQLPASQFVRIQRNYIVNIKSILKIDIISNEVFLNNGTSLFFSRRYYTELINHFNVLK